MMIFRTAYCDELVESLKTEEGLSAYDENLFDPDASKCMESPIALQGEVPELSLENDADAAIAVHQSLNSLTELEASQKRVWATMTHTIFRDYVMARWPIRTTEKVAKRNAVLRRWFAEGGSDRTLEQNAIARLWWGAHLTYAPWKTDPGSFSHLENDDDYYLTRRLFSLQELIKVTLESRLGRSQKFLVALLAYLDKHPENVNNEDVGALMSELNLVSVANKILVLSPTELEELIEQTAESVLD